MHVLTFHKGRLLCLLVSLCMLLLVTQLLREGYAVSYTIHCPDDKLDQNPLFLEPSPQNVLDLPDAGLLAARHSDRKLDSETRIQDHRQKLGGSNKTEEEEYSDDDIVVNDFEDDDYENYYDENGNPYNDVFKDGDFDDIVSVVRKSNVSRHKRKKNRHLKKEPMKRFSPPVMFKSATGGKSLITLTKYGVPAVEDRIFWSEYIEGLAPKGTENFEVDQVFHKLRTQAVVKVESPSWKRCGRPKNQFITLGDGTHFCARYRHPHQYLILGEVLSFYLSRLLGLTTVPVVALSQVSNSSLWKDAAIQKATQKAGWKHNTTFALIQWIDNLDRDRMPVLLLKALQNHSTLSFVNDEFLGVTTKQLIELMQWSDLIIFDYLTGNYDRVASMQDAAEKEHQPNVFKDTIHNLLRSSTTGGLWLLDNEGGLLDSYNLMYKTAGANRQFIKFHGAMLNATCIFRRKTVSHLKWLLSQPQPHNTLYQFARQYEPLLDSVWKDADKTEFIKNFSKRIREIIEHIKDCSTWE